MDNSTGQHGPAPQPPAAPHPPAPPIPPGSELPARAGRGSGATAGIVLILIGAGLLAAQFLPGVRIWMLWPLFIIVPGLVQCFTPGSEGWSIYRFFDGIVTVAVGAILMGNTLGYVSWSIWWQILQLWPVLLISAGLGILGKSTGQEWIRVLGTVAVLLAFAYAVGTANTASGMRMLGVPGGEPFQFSEPAGAVRTAELELTAGVGEVEIGSGTTGLVTIVGESPFSAPEFSAAASGATARVEFDLTGKDDFVSYPGATTARVAAELSDDVLWDLSVDSGVSAFQADLTKLRVRSMALKTGVSSNRVVLGEVPEGVAEATLSIDTGVSSVKVLVPDASMVRVESNSGLTGHSIAKGLEDQGGGVWQTPGYDQAVQASSGVWTILVKSGVGSVTVETY